MRDAFLIFLLVVAAAILGGYGWFVVWLIRTAADSDEDAGCGLWLILMFTGCFAIGIAGSLISVVGHAVGIDMSQLTSQW